MGGSGSGYWCRWDAKPTTESQNRIDVRWLKKNGYLEGRKMGSLSWSCKGKKTGSIFFQIEENRIKLFYRHRPKGGEWESVEQKITLIRTPCNYGGYRIWFRCSNCMRRVAIIYGAGKYFYCRHCYGLTYSSQQESKVDRLMRKARKIRKRLGADINLSIPIMIKPKHMHQQTFDCFREKADYANHQALMIMGQRLGLFNENLFL